MIRKITSSDKTSVASYLVSKLNMPLLEAIKKANKIIKSGRVSFLKEERDLSGLCYTESRVVNGVKTNFVEIIVNNWRLAEDFIQVLRWNLDGIYWFSLPRHDFLNRTLNKIGIRFVRVDGDRNVYCYKFEKRNFYSFKSEDNEE
jgi:hypothetical protein